MGTFQPAKTKNEPNRHAGTHSTYDMYQNKLRQEIDFIKKILLDNGYHEDIELKYISKKIAQFSTAKLFQPENCPLYLRAP